MGRALEPAEEKAILDMAAKNRSPLIYPFLYTLAWTGMRSDEARTLRWSRVNLGTAEIVVGKAGKGRRIPMRATHPDHYVFPQSNRRAPVDPALPVGVAQEILRERTEGGRREVQAPQSPAFVLHKAAGAGVPESTMLDIMGHVSTAMLKRYSHIRAQARSDAIDALESREIANEVPKDFPKVDESVMAKSVVTH